MLVDKLLSNTQNKLIVNWTIYTDSYFVHEQLAYIIMFVIDLSLSMFKLSIKGSSFKKKNSYMDQREKETYEER